MRGQVPEVEPGRKAARGLRVGPVALLEVALEALVEKARERGARGTLAAAHPRGRDRMIDRERREGRRIAREQLRRGRQPAPSHRLGDRRRRRQALRQRVCERHRCEVRQQLLLEVATERVGGRELALRGGQGQQAVAVHDLEAERQPCRRRRDHAGQEEGRVLVGDDDRGVGSEGGEEAAAGAGLRLDVREVGHAARAEGGGVVRHAVEHEAVQAVARPGVAGAQRFEDNQGEAEVAGPVGGPLEGEVEARAARRDHPVKNETAVAPDRRRVGGADPHRRDGGSRCPIHDGWAPLSADPGSGFGNHGKKALVLRW